MHVHVHLYPYAVARAQVLNIFLALMIEAFTRSMSSRRRETPASAGLSLALDKSRTWWLSSSARNRVAPAPPPDGDCVPLADEPEPPGPPQDTEKHPAAGDMPQGTAGGEQASHVSQQAISSGESATTAATGAQTQSQEPAEAPAASEVAAAALKAADSGTGDQTSPLMVQPVEAAPNALSPEAPAAAKDVAGAAQDKPAVVAEATLRSISEARSTEPLVNEELQANTRCGVFVEDCLWSICSPKYAM